MKDLYETLVNLNIEQIHNDVDCINRGGCGWFALELSKELTRNGFKNNIVVIGDSGIDSDISKLNRGSIRLRCTYSWTHFMVNIGDYLIDSEGIHIKKSYSSNCCEEVRRVFKNRLSEWVREDFCWNKDFDTDDIPLMRKLIKQLFNKSY